MSKELCGGKVIFGKNFSVLIIMQIMVTKKCTSVWRGDGKELNYHGLEMCHVHCDM